MRILVENFSLFPCLGLGGTRRHIPEKKKKEDAKSDKKQQTRCNKQDFQGFIYAAMIGILQLDS